MEEKKKHPPSPTSSLDVDSAPRRPCNIAAVPLGLQSCFPSPISPPGFFFTYLFLLAARRHGGPLTAHGIAPRLFSKPGRRAADDCGIRPSAAETSETPASESSDAARRCLSPPGPPHTHPPPHTPPHRQPTNVDSTLTACANTVPSGGKGSSCSYLRTLTPLDDLGEGGLGVREWGVGCLT